MELVGRRKAGDGRMHTRAIVESSDRYQVTRTVILIPIGMSDER